MLFARSIDVWKGNEVLVETAFTNFKRMMKCVISMQLESTTKMPLISVMFS